MQLWVHLSASYQKQFGIHIILDSVLIFTAIFFPDNSLCSMCWAEMKSPCIDMVLFYSSSIW